MRVRRGYGWFAVLRYMEDGFHAASQKSRSNVLLSRVFPHVLFPPQAAHMGEPNQVHSLT